VGSGFIDMALHLWRSNLPSVHEISRSAPERSLATAWNVPKSSEIYVKRRIFAHSPVWFGEARKIERPRSIFGKSGPNAAIEAQPRPRKRL